MSADPARPEDRIAAARHTLQAVRDDLILALKGNRSRQRGPLVRQLHEVQRMVTPGFPYASQAGQDVTVERILKGKRGGTFLDIGAYDGLSGSNTLYFEKYLGWTGVLVEPVKQHRETAELWRSSPCLPFAVADTDGEATFIAVTKGYTQMSGLAGRYDDAILARVRADPRHTEEQVTVQTRTLNAIFDAAGQTQVDFISLDIEGGEAAALATFDASRYRATVWAIENNTASPDIGRMMRNYGYVLAEFCGVDDIYVHRDHTANFP